MTEPILPIRTTGVNRQKWFEKKWSMLSTGQQAALHRVQEGKGETVDPKLLTVLHNRMLIERTMVQSLLRWYVPEHVRRCMEKFSSEN
jgi:hypothetical protein